MSKKWKLICFGLILLLLGIGLVWALNRNFLLRNVARITTIGFQFYSDPECTVPIEEINWGTVGLGETHYQVGYLRNIGNGDVTATMFVDNWNPLEAKNAITVTWDSDGVFLCPGEVAEVTINLTTTNDWRLVVNFTDFTFDIHLVATE